jgi:uncharacterized phage-associated protein
LWRLRHNTGFQSRKAAQAVAYFAGRQPGIEKLKLIKLIYLAEREFVSRHGQPMLYDELFSMKDGPVCSSVLNGINGNIDKDGWSSLVSLKDNKKVQPARRVIERESLDELSDAEMDVLGNIWKRFGEMTSHQIRKWTHDNCPEYKEVKSGRLPITYREMAEAVGESDPDHIEQEISYRRRVSSLFGS